MEESPERLKLAEGAKRYSVELDASTADALLRYRDLLLQENRRVNLTGVRDPAEAIERLLLDSLAVGLHLRETAAGPLRAADLGSGGGLPGLVMAIAFPRMELHLVESRRRKGEALLRLASAMGVEGRVHVHIDRLRNLAALRGAFQVVTARAVGALPLLIREAAPFLSPEGGTLVAWKSAPPDEAEARLAAPAARRYGLSEIPPIPYDSYKPCRLVRYRKASARAASHA